MGPDFKGMQRDGFSKRDRILGFKVAVPDPFPPRTEDAFVCAALAQAVDMAQEFSRARSLDWSFEQLRGAMEPLRECLNVAGPVPDVSYWLSPKKAELTEPAEVDTMLSVQLRTRALAPTQADVVLRQRLEQLLEDVLGRDGSGYVDGGDTGSGMMGVYVRVAQPIATQTVLNALRQAGHLDAATVVLRRQDPNVAEEEQYEVVWPEGYSGPVEPGDLFAGLVE